MKTKFIPITEEEVKIFNDHWNKGYEKGFIESRQATCDEILRRIQIEWDNGDNNEFSIDTIDRIIKEVRDK